MKRALLSLVGAAALATPVVDVAQAATKSKVTVVKKTVSGAETQVDRWGTIRVTLVVKKTTTVTGTKKKVTRSIVGVNVPVYPNHTDRSVYINQQALPVLIITHDAAGVPTLVSEHRYPADRTTFEIEFSLRTGALQHA